MTCWKQVTIASWINKLRIGKGDLLDNKMILASLVNKLPNSRISSQLDNWYEQ